MDSGSRRLVELGGIMDWIFWWTVGLAGLLVGTATVSEGEKMFHRVIATTIFLPPFGRIWGWW